MGLMIEFIEHRNRLETHEEPPRSLVRGEDQATVVTRAKLLWKRLEARPEVRKINSRDIERGMALFGLSTLDIHSECVSRKKKSNIYI